MGDFEPLPPSEPRKFERLRSQCLIKGKLFEDPDFPATDKSLFFSQKPPANFVWKRPHEICKPLNKTPSLFVDGGSRFDVSQGMLGDCWLVASISSLALYPRLLHRVVPEDQGFSDSEKYAGLFHFYFWRFGRFQEVVIDDRLPTYNGKLVFMHSEEVNEFWSALFEKAYAKLHGSYEALKGGKAAEAMVDFTGGVTEAYKLSEAPKDLFKIMMKACKRSSMMSCSIAATTKAQMEAKMDNGLIQGHAYSLTDVRKIKVKGLGNAEVELVRVRNPWGNEREWSGAWSDSSSEWKMIPESDRKEIGLEFEDDGESWMSFDDFSKHFTDLEICNLSLESLEDDGGQKLSYRESAASGAWKGKSCGGCRNNDSFCDNPQFFFEVDDPDDPDDPNDDDKCSVLVALMQKNRREKKHLGVEDLCIGFSLYKLDDTDAKKLDKDYFDYHRSLATSGVFTNAREVHARLELEEGRYCVVPCTFNAKEEGEFLLRMYTEKPTKEMPTDPDQEEEKAAAAQAQRENTKGMFKRLAGADGVVDGLELQDILTHALRKELGGGTFSLETCRSIIAITDVSLQSHSLWTLLCSTLPYYLKYMPWPQQLRHAAFRVWFNMMVNCHDKEM
eukprot:scpid39378/ scgid9836/ Calpain-B; Calcium-activated neutral proteinase B; Calpain-B catalytic subunit 1; Calpain-B catalytic subunit 2